MTLTFADLKEKLKQELEPDFLEILDLTTEDLVDLLEMEIENRQERIRNYYDEQDEEDVDWEEGGD